MAESIGINSMEKHGKYLVCGGKTDYAVLLPQNANETEKFAASELCSFFEMATKCRLPIVYDGEEDYHPLNAYLSIGNTSLFNDSGLKLNVKKLSDDGYVLRNYKNSLLMNAVGNSGKLYAVYGFLKIQFGFRVYAADEIFIQSVAESILKDYNKCEVPSFQGRDFHNYTFFNDSLFATRMRLNGVRTKFLPCQGTGSAWSKKYWNHSVFMLLSPKKYEEAHPDWYSHDGTQICFANALENTKSGREMFQTFLENLKSAIRSEPNAKYFMIGQEDFATSCECEKSLAYNRKYGGKNESPSGTLIVFINKVARAIKKWLKKEDPRRAQILKIVTFAYQKTMQPPVTYDQGTGCYSFVPQVVPEKNVVIRFAPLASVYSKNFMDKEVNALAAEAILGWASLGAQLSVWNYNIAFGAYEYPMYNFHTIQENYRIFKKFGVVDILDQGARDTASTPFCALRNFIGAELLWNIDLDMSQLIDEFMEHYYKQVAPYMLEYFNYVNAHYKLMEKTRGFYAYAGAWESRDTAIERYFPKEFVLGSLDIFKKAYAVIEKIEESALRELLSNRVGTEELSPRFIMLDLYRNDYEPQERKKLICMFREDAERLGLKHFREDSQRPEEFKFTIAQKTEQWLKEIEQ